jgi:UDP-N-acetylmuramate dehydrogenase
VEISQNISLAALTSWQVGGLAEYFCSPQNSDELKESLNWAQSKSVPTFILGGGSNVLVSDEGVKGLTISLKKFSQLEITSSDENLEITCLSGTSKSELLKNLLKHKSKAALFLAGIPGDVGGGVVMNAGVSEKIFPREFIDITDWIEVLRPNGDTVKFNKQDLSWDYRHCSGWSPGVITKVGLKIKNDQEDSILDQVKQANKIRLQKQPLDWPSCGSVFMNPPNEKAAQLIDSCGLKGYTLGGAQVSLKHANFIINLGGAKAKDIWQVIQTVQKTVWQQKQIQLKTEVIRVGDWE